MYGPSLCPFGLVHIVIKGRPVLRTEIRPRDCRGLPSPPGRLSSLPGSGRRGPPSRGEEVYSRCVGLQVYGGHWFLPNPDLSFLSTWNLKERLGCRLKGSRTRSQTLIPNLTSSNPSFTVSHTNPTMSGLSLPGPSPPLSILTGTSFLTSNVFTLPPTVVTRVQLCYPFGRCVWVPFGFQNIRTRLPEWAGRPDSQGNRRVRSSGAR